MIETVILAASVVIGLTALVFITVLLTSFVIGTSDKATR